MRKRRNRSRGALQGIFLPERRRQIEGSHNEEDFYLLLPLSPSVNEAYKTVLVWRNGRVSSRRTATKRLKAFQEDALQYLRETLKEYVWPRGRFVGYEAHIFVPSRMSDLSNRLKAVEDVIAEALYFNDNRIYEILVRKYIDASFPRIHMRLYQIDVPLSSPPSWASTS